MGIVGVVAFLGLAATVFFDLPDKAHTSAWGLAVLSVVIRIEEKLNAK